MDCRSCRDNQRSSIPQRTSPDNGIKGPRSELREPDVCARINFVYRTIAKLKYFAEILDE